MSKVEPELPFSIVVLTNLSGQPDPPLPKLRDRRLVRVTRSSIPKLLASVAPQILIDKWRVRIKELQPPSQETIISQLMESGASREEASAIAIKLGDMPEFTDLCASWRNLVFLADCVAQLEGAQIDVWNLSKRELLREFERATDFDQSVCFKRIYSQGLDTFGATPASLVVADYDLSDHPEDLALLEYLSMVSESAAAPILIKAAPRFLRLNRWSDINPELKSQFFNRSPSRAKWCSIRNGQFGLFAFVFLPNLDRNTIESQALAEPSISPVFVAAVAAIRAFRGGNGREPTTECMKMSRAEFELSNSDPLLSNLERMGLNGTRYPLSEQSLLNAVSVENPTEPRRAISLRMVLTVGRISHMLHVVLRNKAPSAIKQITAVQELLESSETLRYLLSLNNAYADLEENDGLLTVKVMFSIEGNSTSWSFDISLRIKNSTGKQSSRTGFSPQVRVLADHMSGWIDPGLNYAHRKAVSVNADNLDTVFAWYFNKRVRLGPYETHETDNYNTLFKCQTLDDFAPEELARQIPACHTLLRDRDLLYELASFADERAGGWAVLESAKRQRSGLRALAARVEAWVSIAANLDLSPVPASFISESIDPWVSADPSYLERILPVLPVYEKWGEGVSSQRSFVGLDDAFSRINNLIDAELRQVYGWPPFGRWERTWRGLRWLVDAAKRSQVSTFAVDWLSQSPTRIADAIQSDWESTGEIVGWWDYGVARPRCVEIAVLDHSLRVEDCSELFRALRNLWLKERLVTICGLASDDHGHTAASVQRLATESWGEGLILVLGQFTYAGSYKSMSSRCSHPWQEGGAFVAPLFTVSAVYPVGAVVAELHQEFISGVSAEARSKLLNPRLAEYGFACQPIGNAILVQPDPEFTKLVASN